MTEQKAEDRSASPFDFTVEEPELWKRVIKVQIAPAHFTAEYARSLRQAVKSHVKPGFRKGRVPKATVEREFGEQLRVQTLERVIPAAFKAAIIAHELVPLTDPQVENLVFEPDQPISFEMSFEVRPKLTARNYDDLPLKERAPLVSDAEVDAIVSRLREVRAVREPVKRPAALGDRLAVDLTPLDQDGTPDLSARAEAQQLVLGADHNIAAFEEVLLGASVGDVRRVQVSYPDDHHSAKLRGRTVTYECEVKQIEQVMLPELNDAFAAGIQAGQTLLELRQTIRADLLREDQARIQRELQEQVVDALIVRNPLSVPPSLVEQYIQSGLQELHGRNAQLGRASTPEEDEHYRQMTRPIAERILKGMFIMEAIRKQENISVASEEVAARITEIATEHGFDPEKYREYAAREAENDRIVHGLQERKTFDFLLTRAKIEKAELAESE